MLVESVFGPLWPWIFLGEAMTVPEIIGGVVVLGAVASLALTTRTPDMAGAGNRKKAAR